MDPVIKAAHERLAKAIEGRDLNGYTEVKPADVSALAAAVAKTKRDEHVEQVEKAAANNAPEAAGVHFPTAKLAHLLDLTGKVEPAPKPKEKDKE